MKTLNTTSRFTSSYAPASRKPESRLTASLHKGWQRLVNLMTDDSQLRVWQASDRQGQTQWHGFDPITGRSFSGSEAEMRSWIEQRYYSEVA